MSLQLIKWHSLLVGKRNGIGLLSRTNRMSLRHLVRSSTTAPDIRDKFEFKLTTTKPNTEEERVKYSLKGRKIMKNVQIPKY